MLGNMLKSKDSRMRKKILATLLDLASSVETDGGPATNEDAWLQVCSRCRAMTNTVHDRGFCRLRKFGGSERTLWRRLVNN